MDFVFSNTFKKDYKLAKKRGKDLSKLEKIFKLLAKKENLSAVYKKHTLKGEFKGALEYHIEPDWILIYCKAKNCITLARLGTHSDLFG